MGLTAQQVQRLITPRPAGTFEAKQGMTYIPTHEVKAELSRIFGPGNWDHTIHDVQCLYETSVDSQGKTYWNVCYRVACTLRVRDFEGNPIAEVTEYHAEENSRLPNRGEAHAMALTSAESYALRRAALDLGDAFGLHLYDKGSKAPLIKGTLMLTEFLAEQWGALQAKAAEAAAAAKAKVQAAMKQEPGVTQVNQEEGQ
jgi:hypothetical protein